MFVITGQKFFLFKLKSFIPFVFWPLVYIPFCPSLSLGPSINITQIISVCPGLYLLWQHYFSFYFRYNFLWATLLFFDVKIF